MAVQATRRLTSSMAFLLVIQLITSAVAVGMLTRVGPTIARILRENVTSVEAVEVMALALADAHGDPAAKERFYGGLARAKSNVTMADEAPAIATLERYAAPALDGDTGARREAVAALGRLGELNRSAIRDVDLSSRRMATAGAWAMVFLAFAGLIASGITLRRLEQRVLTPLAELTRVAAAHRAGDYRRRCAAPAASEDLELVMVTLNELFDHRERTSTLPEGEEARADEHAVMLDLLDHHPKPAVVVDASGKVLAAGKRALDLLAGADGARLKQALAKAARNQDAEGISEARTIGDTEQRVVILATRDASGSSAAP